MWEKIETAPRDSTIIQVRQDQWYPWHAFWDGRSWRPIEYAFGHHPTHWMPCYPRISED
jgi:hypothetical protein